MIKFNESNLKNVDKAKKELIAKFNYLGGNGYTTGNNNSSNLHEYASLVDTEYQPFVLYELEIV